MPRATQPPYFFHCFVTTYQESSRVYDIQSVHSAEQLVSIDLVRHVCSFDFSDAELVPLRMFVVAEKVGGQVMGAFDGNVMVGFALSVPGTRSGHVYLHSHMLAVRKEHRNGGMGRRLKLLHAKMRWPAASN